LLELVALTQFLVLANI